MTTLSVIILGGLVASFWFVSGLWVFLRFLEEIDGDYPL